MLGMVVLTMHREKQTNKKINLLFVHTHIICTMRVLDMSHYTLVKSGIPCSVTAPVQASTLIKIMQCDDKYIYWFENKTGDISTQLSCVNVNDKFYSMPLRLEKAVFRHVRLTKHFENIEYLEDGTSKLRIPARLLREKKRTSSRLKVFICIV